MEGPYLIHYRKSITGCWYDHKSPKLFKAQWAEASVSSAATKQLYEWFSPSVCPSVRPSVTPISLCSHRDHRIIMKFSGVITNDRSDVLAKCQGQRSNIKVTQAKPQFSHFRTVTPVWIHIWWWNGAHSLILLGTGALFWRSSVKFQCHTAKKIVDFDPNWAFPDCNSNLISPVAMKWCTTPEAA